MPILSKAGCNTGACHGSANGKGNLKLSLRGENPEQDYATLTQNVRSKRLNVDDPAASFFLKKPTLQTEHEGGRRFTEDSEEYQILHRWIAAGAPPGDANEAALTTLTVTPENGIFTAPTREVKLQVTATFSNGETRDVTRWAVYEPSNLLVTVSRDGVARASRDGETTVIARFEHLQTPARLAFIPDRPGTAWPEIPERNFIDRHVFAKLRKVRLTPSQLVDDARFVRRVYLDLTGLPPTRREAETFLANPDPDKRDRLVNELLERPEFAAHWAMKWADLLRVEERILDTTGVAAFHGWIRRAMAEDLPLDQFTRAIVSATGSTYQNPPANFYRSLREPVLRSEAVAQVFLGTRLACAKCHNHPFEKWTQTDYYRFAALFDGIDYEILKNDRKDENDKLEFVGEQIVHLKGKKELKDPRDGKEPPPGFLGESAGLPEGNRLEQLAAWMTRPEHPLFARVQANRIWFQLTGTGIVEPVDDFRMTNPPSNPELLEALTRAFVENGMRVKPLIRLICQSSVYQLAPEPNADNAEDTLNFSRTVPRRLPAETLLDAVHQALDVRPEFAAYPDVSRAGEIPGVRFMGRGVRPKAADTFLKEFGKPPRTITCDCERTNESSLAQVFTLTSGPGISRLLDAPDNLLKTLSRPETKPEEALEELYWRCLTRAPSAAEREKLTPPLAAAKAGDERREALEDLAWSLLNSKEFILRR